VIGTSSIRYPFELAIMIISLANSIPSASSSRSSSTDRRTIRKPLCASVTSIS